MTSLKLGLGLRGADQTTFFLIPSGDMDSGGDFLIPSGDMDSGGDKFLWSD